MIQVQDVFFQLVYILVVGDSGVYIHPVSSVLEAWADNLPSNMDVRGGGIYNIYGKKTPVGGQSLNQPSGCSTV